MTTNIILIVLLIIVGVTLSPLAIIWALNTLFPTLSIPFTFWTWLATLVLFMSVSVKRK